MLAVSMKKCLLVLLLFSSVGCSGFFSRDTHEKPKVIEVKLSAGWLVNPDKMQSSQPVKICIIETRRAGWLPPRLYEGNVCGDLSNSADIVNYESYILAPGQSRTYLSNIIGEEKYSRWVVVGAEFQQGLGEHSLIELMVDSKSDFKIEVSAENTSLTVL